MIHLCCSSTRLPSELRHKSIPGLGCNHHFHDGHHHRHFHHNGQMQHEIFLENDDDGGEDGAGDDDGGGESVIPQRHCELCHTTIQPPSHMIW